MDKSSTARAGNGAEAFDLPRFVAQCRRHASDRSAVCELVRRAVSQRPALVRSLGEPQRGEIRPLLQSEELTILNVCWAPAMTLKPHNHQMWAVIGIYTGREDNILWRRLPSRTEGGAEGDADDERSLRSWEIEAAGAVSLGPGDVLPLGEDVIHSVTNPLPRVTGAIHVYGGDFYRQARSEWDAESMRERPYDVAAALRAFEGG